jgi:6-phosphogluconate dehydrogenase
MDIGIVGLSDGNVARRLARGGINVFGFDAKGRAATLAGEKILTAMPTAVALARALTAPRVVWMDVAPGFDTELMIQELWPELRPGDVIVDTNGTQYQDAQRRAAALATARIDFIDCTIAPIADDPGNGHVLVFGANPAAARIFAPYAQILTPDNGWLHCGPVGSGHFVAMVLDGTNAAHALVNDAMEPGVAAPVSSLALMLQSGRVRGNTRAERLLAAISESFDDETVPARGSIK